MQEKIHSMQEMYNKACLFPPSAVFIMCGYSMWFRYLEPKRVEAGVCLAANRAIGLNFHSVQQVVVTETGRPANVKLCLLDAAGPKVMELEMRRKLRISWCLLFYWWVPGDRGYNKVTTTVGRSHTPPVLSFQRYRLTGDWNRRRVRSTGSPGPTIPVKMKISEL